MSDNSIQLSIIIVNWNTRDLLRQCLQSIEENPIPFSHEVIVVDNASSDDSVAMLKACFPAVKVIEATENLGFAKANNLGIGASRGDAILLLNSDTIVHGDAIAKSHRYLNSLTELGAMACRVLNHDGTDQSNTSQFPSLTNLGLQTLGLDRIPTKLTQRYKMGRMNRAQAQAVETLSGCYMMIKRQTLEAVGLLDEDFFFFGEETDWCRRAKCKGYALHYAPVGQITHLGGGSSGTLNHRRDLMLTEATIRLHRKHSGAFAGLVCFLLLWIFNGSRALYWGVGTRLAPSKPKASRALHFRAIIRDFASAWPTRKKRITA